MSNFDFDKLIKELTEKAKRIHAHERRITLESIRIVGELEQRKVWNALGMSVESFAVYIGLTPSKYWKRAAAFRMINRFPLALEIFEKGEVDVSHLAMIAGRITDANSRIILEGIRGKSKRETADFLSRVMSDGRVLDSEGYIEMTIRIKVSQNQGIERAREVLAHGGHVPTNAEIILRAVDDLLEKRDPMQKAERAELRKQKSSSSNDSSQPAGAVVSNLNFPGEAPSSKRRIPVPAALRHAVMLRDKGQCTYVHGDGTLCGTKMMLELDHIQMVCRGGNNEFDNLRMRCRFHNRHTAEEELEQSFCMKK